MVQYIPLDKKMYLKVNNNTKIKMFPLHKDRGSQGLLHNQQFVTTIFYHQPPITSSLDCFNRLSNMHHVNITGTFYFGDFSALKKYADKNDF